MSRKDIIADANVWTVAADIKGMRHYPKVLIESGKRPDMVHPSTDAIILVELTVSEAAEVASFWIWQMRSHKSSKGTSGKPEKAVDLWY